MNTATAKLAEEMMNREMTKEEVIRRIVDTVRATFPGLPSDAVKRIAWDFYVELNEAVGAA